MKKIEYKNLSCISGNFIGVTKEMERKDRIKNRNNEYLSWNGGEIVYITLIDGEKTGKKS